MQTEHSARSTDRLMMICIDAMSLGFVREHRDQLPVFSGLLQEGALQELSTPASHASASIWVTYATGTGPGVHGHYFPFQWDFRRMRFGRTLKPEFESQIPFEPFWHSLAKRGVETIAFDMGGALDASRAPCLEIANWSYQSSGHMSTSDPEVLRELLRRFGKRPIGKEVPVPKDRRQSDALRDQMIRALKRKTDATLWLAAQRDWRLFAVGFYEIHRAGHNLLAVDADFGSEAAPEALLDVYREQDRQLGRLIDAALDGRTTVALYSLHGMEENRAQDHFMAPVLARLNEAYRNGSDRAPRAAPKPNLMSSLRARVPSSLQYYLANILGEDVQDWVVNRTLTGGLQWSSTPSFAMLSAGEGFIRFNIKGRERDGYFERDGEELSRYRQWLIDRLFEIRVTGSGEKLVLDIADSSVLFPGARRDYLPDLFVTFAPAQPATSVSSPVIGEVTAKLRTGRGGNHVGEAFVMFKGPAARVAATAGLADIKDLAAFVERILTHDAAEQSAPRLHQRA